MMLDDVSITEDDMDIIGSTGAKGSTVMARGAVVRLETGMTWGMEVTAVAGASITSSSSSESESVRYDGLRLRNLNRRCVLRLPMVSIHSIMGRWMALYCLSYMSSQPASSRLSRTCLRECPSKLGGELNDGSMVMEWGET